jgi:hypothetical protein
MAKNGAHQAHILCLRQRLKCIISKQTPSKQHVLWRLACVADLVRASSLAAVKTSPKNACWCRALAGFKAAFPCTTHTPVSFRPPARHTKQGKHAKVKQKLCKESTRIAPFFRMFFSLYAVVGEAAISLRRRPARRHLVSTARTQTR